MFPNRNIPSTMPDISMRQLTEDEIKDLRDVSLANALKEARHRLKVKYDKLRDDIDAKFDELLAAIGVSSAPAADTTPPSAKTTAPVPETLCDSPTSKLKSVLVEERSARRRLNDGTTRTDIDQNEASSSQSGPSPPQHHPTSPTSNLQRD